ncbi:MAG: hypothetical protein QOH32_393 [Bradyrhizobium sp.]|jgi:hypothetical protein|nr:hypothetical protein [Bradyrhizobium sp.]
MADGDTNGKPDGDRALARAAVDEAYQEQVKHLFEILHSANVTDSAKAAVNESRAEQGLALANKTRATMRKLIGSADL